MSKFKLISATDSATYEEYLFENESQELKIYYHKPLKTASWVITKGRENKEEIKLLLENIEQFRLTLEGSSVNLSK